MIRGIVPDTFDLACPNQVAFLHLDLNSSASEIAALDVLFDRVSPGGMIVFDDYGQLPHINQHIKEDNYLEKKGYQILELPTGQGLLVKR